MFFVQNITDAYRPGRLVHAFSRPDYEHMSTANYFENLNTLIVEFDAGTWDPRMGIYGTTEWHPQTLIKDKVRLPEPPRTSGKEGLLTISRAYR